MLKSRYIFEVPYSSVAVNRHIHSAFMLNDLARLMSLHDNCGAYEMRNLQTSNNSGKKRTLVAANLSYRIFM